MREFVVCVSQLAQELRFLYSVAHQRQSKVPSTAKIFSECRFFVTDAGSGLSRNDDFQKAVQDKFGKHIVVEYVPAKEQRTNRAAQAYALYAPVYLKLLHGGYASKKDFPFAFYSANLKFNLRPMRKFNWFSPLHYFARMEKIDLAYICLLYTSDAADE